MKLGLLLVLLFSQFFSCWAFAMFAITLAYVEVLKHQHGEMMLCCSLNHKFLLTWKKVNGLISWVVGLISPRVPFWVITTFNTPEMEYIPACVQFFKLSNEKRVLINIDLDLLNSCYSKR